ncbi:MAG: DNA mismatch repair endonuclease MutL [Bacilli bacterium]|nr:DNA mismatch repair endonuclease MutL [Bacilli bacterium]
MSVIKVLDSTLSNKIAAGEVVERPASVVKEVLENSLDAKATQIIIKIKGAGKNEIMISDNGIGMDKEDAVLAFSRHATSKLKNERDLFKISTLGFRGEALASIASVSNIVLETCKENEVGTRVELVNGKVESVEPSKSNKGTTIYIRNLFYNTPARLKFLKSDNVEFSHISDIVMKLALAYPHVSFTLYNEDKISFYSSGKGNVLEIVSSLYGLDVAKNMNKFEGSNDDFTISGYTSSLGVSRSNKYGIITILNGRCVRLTGAINAIIESYKTYLSDDRYPITIINIETDYSLVDVNVHPSKQEVRLSKELELKELIFDSIKDVFMVKNIAPKVSVKEKEIKEQTVLSIDDLNIGNNNYTPSLSINETLISENKVNYENTDESISKTRLTPIGQYIAKYILASDGESLYIVDQHAAAERINYELFSKKFNDFNNWTYTDLLIPSVITLTKKESAILMENLDVLKDVGIAIEEFGENSFRVTSIPTWMKEVDSNNYLDEIVEQVVSGNKRIDLQTLRIHVISTMACKASLKANKVLSYIEMQTLLDNLLKCDNPYTCPHGRPTTIIYSTSDLDKLFKRS